MRDAHDGDSEEMFPALDLELESRHHTASFTADLISPAFDTSPIATISYDVTKEKGKIAMHGTEEALPVVHSFWRGKWQLLSHTKVLASGTKNYVFRRNFFISYKRKHFFLSPTGGPGRDFKVLQIPRYAELSGEKPSGILIGRFTAVPGDSKAYRIAFSKDIDMIFIAFCLWLINLMNRRYETTKECNYLSI